MSQTPNGRHNKEVKAELQALHVKIAELNARITSIAPATPSSCWDASRHQTTARGAVFSKVLAHRWPLCIGFLALTIGAVAQQTSDLIAIGTDGRVRMEQNG